MRKDFLRFSFGGCSQCFFFYLFLILFYRGLGQWGCFFKFFFFNGFK